MSSNLCITDREAFTCYGTSQSACSVIQSLSCLHTTIVHLLLSCFFIHLVLLFSPSFCCPFPLSLSYQFLLMPLNTLMVSCNVSYGIKRQKTNHNIRPLPYKNATANLMPSYIRFIVSQHYFASFDKVVWMLL